MEFDQNLYSLRTKRLLLRPIVEEDLKHVFEGLSHPEVYKYYGVRYRTLEETKEQMEFYKDLEERGTGRFWAICSTDNTTFYGVGGLNDVHREHKKAEVGFWILPDYWGEGIMTEALPVICKFGFNHWGLHRIEGFVESRNTGCIAALKKLKFHYEGTMRDCEFKNEKFISLAIYAIFRSDIV